MPTDKKRDWSQVKRRPHGRVNFTTTPEERAYIDRQAEAAGVSVAEYVRAAALGVPPLRQRPRPQIDRQLCAAILAELGKTGSNLNQIARALNQQTALTMDDFKVIRSTRGDVAQMRDRLMKALGLEP
jgi:uncharacterized protein (DUF1778 family)